MTTDPIQLQRQLHTVSERADELEAQLEAVARLAAPLLVEHSTAVDTELRLCRLEAALEAQGFVLPNLRAGVSGAIRDRYRARMEER